MFMPYFIFSALLKCCLVLGTSEMNQLIKVGAKRETCGVATFIQHLSKRAESE